MATKFVVSHLDEQLGPFDEAEIKAKWSKGDLLPIDYVYDEAKQDWILLSERFTWAAGKPEASAPPPLRDVVLRKQRPPDAPKPVEISGASVVKEWKKDTSLGARVKMVDGIGEIDLSPMQPGNVEVVLQESSAGMLRLQNPLKIQVKPAEPVALEWSMVAPNSVTGQEIFIAVKAVDVRGQICSHFEDQFVVRVAASKNADISVHLRAGVAQVKLNHTLAETWKMSLQHSGARALKMPAELTLEWQPGPAVRLILDGPPEYVAGHPLKVHVKAVDQYGNLAKTFQGTVILEVKAS